MTETLDTTNDMTTHIAATIDTHLEAFGSADAGHRDGLLRRVWTERGRLIDPPIDGAGHDGISQMMAAVQSLYPGTFRRTSAVDVHHGVARYSWELVAADGSVSLTGLDIADVDVDGKLTRVVGFLGDLAPA